MKAAVKINGITILKSLQIFLLEQKRQSLQGRLTKRIRTEMIQSLSCLVMIHTKSPSSEQYNLVCRKLIEKYPTLKDDIGSTGYVSVVILVWGLPAYFIQDVGV